MYKNLTINQVALLISVLVGILNGCIILFLFLGSRSSLNPILSLTIILTTVLISFLAVKLLLNRFIFRRIKLIYKIIRNSKANPDHPTNSDPLNEKNLDEVKTEVERWAESAENEIQYLKTLETYRRNFVGNLSHELKTPIFSIQGYLYTLLDGGLYDKKINRKYLERAASNADRLQTIVEDLEIINKLESGATVLDFTKFDLKALTKEVFNDLELLAKKKSIKMGFKDGAHKAFQVQADRESIRQVLLNLITNAVKYGREKGEILISFYDMDENILVEISDTGIGIGENHLKHVFDRFYRVDTSRSRKMGGSGLGLSIVKHIVEAHQQTINVRSTVDVGSTFGFTLKKAV